MSLQETGLTIPRDQPWPVKGRDPATGSLLIDPEFAVAVEEANGLEDGTLTGDDLIGLLVIWYGDRLEAGAEPDPHMEGYLADTFGDLTTGDDEEAAEEE